VRDGDEWVINGHKWFTSNGLAADFFIVMVRVHDDSPGARTRPGQMAQIIVPTDTPASRSCGHRDLGPGQLDHCEVKYNDVRVPSRTSSAPSARGHQAAQDRLGAGRVFHCMNSIGQMWRAFDLMVERTTTRQVHGGLQRDKQFIQGFIADSYIDIQAARLMTIHCAEKVDRGLKEARTDISASRCSCRRCTTGSSTGPSRCGGGRRVERPAAGRHVHGRPHLRLADGPDEVHKILIAKNVLGRYDAGESWDFGQLTDARRRAAGRAPGVSRGAERAPVPSPGARPRPRPLRAVADGVPARRGAPDGALQLGRRTAGRRHVRPAHRGHRRGPQPGGLGHRHRRLAALVRPRLGRAPPPVGADGALRVGGREADRRRAHLLVRLHPRRGRRTGQGARRPARLRRALPGPGQGAGTVRCAPVPDARQRHDVVRRRGAR
jgi:hypothetical protein